MAGTRAVLTDAARRLSAAGIDEARLDARVLLAEAAGVEPSQVLPHADREIEPDVLARFEKLLARRLDREPVSRIVGRRSFWTLDLALSQDTLDPRPDSETLIDALLAYRPDKAAPLRLLDLGTGTGCLLLAALSEYPNASGIGVDIAPGAVDTATGNAEAAGLSDRARFTVGDWSPGPSETFDVVLGNPPYIPTAEIEALAPEVRAHDPRLALDGGPDGLKAYRRIIEALPGLLTPAPAGTSGTGGLALLEIGATQAGPVGEIVGKYPGLTLLACRADLAGRPRCMVVGNVRPISTDP